MKRPIMLGRVSQGFWWIWLLLPCLYGCPSTGGDPDMTSTPVPTPIIVVGNTPSPSTSPTPKVIVDSMADREEILQRVGSAIERAREDFPGETAVYFVDVESDLELDYSGDQQFESASLMKLVVIAELFRRFQVGQLDPEQSLLLERKHIVGGSGELKTMDPGTSFTLVELADKMITQSDNTATQMLTELLTKEELNKSTEALGLSGTTINRDIYDFAAIDRGRDNYITARDAAHILEQVAREELPGSSSIHAILEKQERNDMIGRGLPKSVRVAHKTGELNGILHDVGIVYAPKGSYVLAMLSQGVTDKERAVEVLSSLSQEIYGFYQQASPSPNASTE